MRQRLADRVSLGALGRASPAKRGVEVAHYLSESTYPKNQLIWLALHFKVKRRQLSIHVRVLRIRMFLFTVVFLDFEFVIRHLGFHRACFTDTYSCREML